MQPGSTALSRFHWLLLSILLSLAVLFAPRAHANDKLTFLTRWYAQAEHGGFYQAVARGIHKSSRAGCGHGDL